MTCSVLNLAIVLPRNMHFGPARATAIDLAARDYVHFSRFSAGITLVAERVDRPFEGPRVHWFESGEGADGIVAALREVSPDLILIEQHRPTASAVLRAFPRIPVVLHRHGAQKVPRNPLSAWLLRRAYRRFAGLVVKSTPIAEELDRLLPGLGVPVRVAGNGLDISQWHPAETREKTMLFVGRLSPDKGVAEAAEAAVRCLDRHAEWRARFILTELDRFAEYGDRVRALLGSRPDRIAVEDNVPHGAVRQAFETAAIALVPSVYVEAFGRTALEAMAGGAALVHSGRGGLAEVGGSGASVTLPEITAEAIAGAVGELIEDPGRRAGVAAAGRARAEELFDIRRQAALLDDALVEFSNDYKLRRRP